MTGMQTRRMATADLVYCGLFTALIAVGAFIKIMIPLGIWEVTFSLQFLFSLLAGFLLGPRRGLMSVISYLIIGLAGVPIFAHGGGPAYLMKPTFGFLIGFAAAAYLAGVFRGRSARPGFPRLLFAALVGDLAYYACGLIYYYIMFNFVLTNGMTIGVRELFLVWFLSTVVPDFVLCLLAASLACRLIPLLDLSGTQ